MEDSSTEATEHPHHHGHNSYGQSGRVLEPSPASEAQPAEPPVPSPAALPDYWSPHEPKPAPPPPIPPSDNASPMPANDPEHPLAVTQVYSSYGIEYIIMLISLAVAAIGFTSLLSAILDMATTKSGGSLGTFVNPMAEATLIVGFPIFAYLFLRLEAKEESDRSFLADASRRRALQITLIVSFIIFIVELIGYIGGLLSSGSDMSSGTFSLFSSSSFSGSGASWWVNLLHALINLVVTGTIFGYYWYKLHKKTGPS